LFGQLGVSYLNHEKDVIIIGCGAAGGTAAQFARKTDRKSSITIFEEGEYPQYSKCGLPYAISGDVKNLDDLIEFSSNWFKNAHIDLILNTKVEKIDVNKKIIIAKKENETIEKSYNSLIIATGAKPYIPPIKNIIEEGKLVNGVFVLRTINDAQQISSNIQKGKKAVIIGAGFIGLEMADNLFKKEMKITVIEALPWLLPNTFDEDMANIVCEALPKDVDVFTDHIVTKIESKSGKIYKVFLKNNKTNEEKELSTDILIIGTGCKPDTFLAQNIGCKIGKAGHIIVNNRCETSIGNIYAVGDCTQYKDFVTKKPVPIGLGSIAVRQGIAAGVNAVGGNNEMPDGVLQSCTSEFFGIEIAAVGPSTDYLKELSTVSGKFSGYSRAEYFPGGKKISIKVFADEKTGKIVAAHAIGDKAAKRINTFACAILSGMDIETFKKLETTYAPPIAPTLDAETLVCDIVSMKINRRR
jgi:NADPH-dependent 2,4-dienoyl-CoA reductase/sulfur reductase-like enzyme